MSGSLITGRSHEAERDRCRSSTSPPDQSAGTRPQGPARRPSGRSFRRGIEDATVRGLVNGAQPSDPSGGYRRASNAAKRAQRLQSGRSVANMATDPARASSRSSGRRRKAPRMTHSASKCSRAQKNPPQRQNAQERAKTAHSASHGNRHRARRRAARAPEGDHRAESGARPEDLRKELLEHRGTAAAGPGIASQQLTGLWIRPADRRAAPAAPSFRIAGSQSRELQADSCAASRRRRTPSCGTPAERHTITAERGRALKERRGASRERRRDTRERRGAATDGRRSDRERRGAATERCSEIRKQLGKPPEGRRHDLPVPRVAPRDGRADHRRSDRQIGRALPE